MNKQTLKYQVPKDDHLTGWPHVLCLLWFTIIPLSCVHELSHSRGPQFLFCPLQSPVAGTGLALASHYWLSEEITWEGNSISQLSPQKEGSRSRRFVWELIQTHQQGDRRQVEQEGKAHKKAISEGYWHLSAQGS